VRPSVRIEIFDEFPPNPPHDEIDIGCRLVLGEADFPVDARSERPRSFPAVELRVE